MNDYEVVAQSSMNDGGSIALAVIPIIILLFFCICKAIQYKKAGENPIAAFIPIWNIWVWVKIATGSGAKMFLFLIPIFGQLLPLVYNYKYYHFFTQSAGLPILSFIAGPIVDLIITFGKYPVNRNKDDSFDIETATNITQPTAETNAHTGAVSMQAPSKTVSMKCKACHKLIKDLQPGQVFYCGYCMTELTAPMK